MQEELLYQLALSNTAGIGPARGRVLLQSFGSASEIYKASIAALKEVEGISTTVAKLIKQPLDNAWLERESSFLDKYEIQTHFFNQETFPKRLRHINDAPLMLFSKGNMNMNAERKLAIIGTRQSSPAGSELTAQIVADLKPYNVQIYSGLAFGIDIAAHRAALRSAIPTVGVVAHGLHELYPSEHKRTATDMLAHGGLISEYPCQSKMEKYNFPMRNRIVAGICEAVLVVETSIKGGAMITAKLAAGYNRDVFAIPGRVNDARSIGCNYLIRTNIAGLVTSAKDIVEALNWEEKTALSGQPRLFNDLGPDEEKVVETLQSSEGMHIDELTLKSGKSNSILAKILLQLELQGIVLSLAGKRYKLR